MKLDTLEALWIEELKDLWSAERQIVAALPRMIRAAGARALKKAFTVHLRQTRQHIKRLERVLKAVGASPRGKKCVGMEALLKEGADLIKEKPEPDVLDAGLISAAQHVEHYEMAGYGTVRTWARLLGYEQHAQTLQKTLDEEGAADQGLSGLAQSINIAADRGDPA